MDVRREIVGEEGDGDSQQSSCPRHLTLQGAASTGCLGGIVFRIEDDEGGGIGCVRRWRWV